MFVADCLVEKARGERLRSPDCSTEATSGLISGRERVEAVCGGLPSGCQNQKQDEGGSAEQPSGEVRLPYIHFEIAPVKTRFKLVAEVRDLRNPAQSSPAGLGHVRQVFGVWPACTARLASAS